VVCKNRGGSGTRPTRLAVTELVRIVLLDAADAGLHFEPSSMILGAREQCAIRTGDFSIFAIGDRIANEVNRRVGLRIARHGAIELGLHGGENRRRFGGFRSLRMLVVSTNSGTNFGT